MRKQRSHVTRDVEHCITDDARGVCGLSDSGRKSPWSTVLAICAVATLLILSGCTPRRDVVFRVVDGDDGVALEGVRVARRSHSVSFFSTGEELVRTYLPTNADGIAYAVEVPSQYRNQFLFTKEGYWDADAIVGPEWRRLLLISPITPDTGYVASPGLPRTVDSDVMPIRKINKIPLYRRGPVSPVTKPE